MPKLETRNAKLVNASSVELTRVRDFKDLLVWKLARQLRIQVYEQLKKLPVEERFALSSQLTRSVQSIGANIAEGFGRYSFQENFQSSRQARGSAYEVRGHLVTASGCCVRRWLYQRTPVYRDRGVRAASDTAPRRLHSGDLTKTGPIEGKVRGVTIFEWRFSSCE